MQINFKIPLIDYKMNPVWPVKMSEVDVEGTQLPLHEPHGCTDA